VAKASESRPIESGLRPQFQERVAAVQVKLQAAETLAGARVRME
jgi:hypothetical protein